MLEKHNSSATHGAANLPLTRDIVQGPGHVRQRVLAETEWERQEPVVLHLPSRTRDVKRLAVTQGLDDLDKKLTPIMLRKVAGTTVRSVLPEVD